MEKFFQNLVSKNNGAYNKDKKSYFSGEAYFPIHIYTTSLEKEYSTIEIEYKWTESDFIYSDFHYCVIKYRFSNKIQSKNFTLKTKSIFQRIFNSDENQFTIKSKDALLKETLEKDKSLVKSLNELYSHSVSDIYVKSEFYGEKPYVFACFSSNQPQNKLILKLIDLLHEIYSRLLSKYH